MIDSTLPIEFPEIYVKMNTDYDKRGDASHEDKS